MALSPDTTKPSREWHDELFATAWSLYRKRHLRKAIEVASQAMKIDDGVSTSWVGYGIMLGEAGFLDKAIECHRLSIKRTPRYAAAWSQLGDALRRSRRLDAALVCHQRALGFAPQDAAVHYRFGMTLVALGRDEDAIEMFERANVLDGSHGYARWERSESRRRLGGYPEGWADYELRFDARSEKTRPRSERERWDGGPYEGQTLLVMCEKGYGDMIWASRFCAPAKRRGGRLILQCQRELIASFESLEGPDEIVDAKAPAPHHDLYIPACSLPGLLEADSASILGRPYLRSNPERAAKYSSWLGLAGDRLKVGLIWSGSVYHVDNAARTAPLATLVDALDLPGVALYSLQKSQPSADISTLGTIAGAVPVFDIGPLLDDFADTAGLLSGLDLMITTDTSTAHLAGALGLPVWVLLNKTSYWLWGREGASTPWYDSAKLFRARTWDNWMDVADQAAAQLMRLAEGREGRAKGHPSPPPPLSTFGDNSASA